MLETNIVHIKLHKLINQSFPSIQNSSLNLIYCILQTEVINSYVQDKRYTKVKVFDVLQAIS